MTNELDRLIWESRRLFRAAAKVADSVLQPFGITASQRALVEFLAREEHPISLSELARKRAVSRQHIQQTLARFPYPQWVSRKADPTDARSQHLALSPSGRDAWEKIRMSELALLEHIQADLDVSDLKNSADTIRAVRTLFEELDEAQR